MTENKGRSGNPRSRPLDLELNRVLVYSEVVTQFEQSFGEEELLRVDKSDFTVHVDGEEPAVGREGGVCRGETVLLANGC